MNSIAFHKSITQELLVIKDRVRNLIKHWGEDGRYQEAVLKAMIQRFLPERFKVGSGFVVSQTTDRTVQQASRQIDLLVYDSNFPVLFKEGDFVILTGDSVKAVIEVKANLEKQGLEKVIVKANKVGEFVYNSKSDKSTILFNGVFSYGGFVNQNIGNFNKIDVALQNTLPTSLNDLIPERYLVNHISFNKDLFFKYWSSGSGYSGAYLYELEDLSFSFFISNLISHLAKDTVSQNNHLWFPIDKSIISAKL